jgi:hypothetical protein
MVWLTTARSHQALRHSQSMSIHSCYSSAQNRSICPVFLSIQNILSRGIVIHVVHCLNEI